MGSTGIPINFGITILLGFIVGVAIAGQTFYLFTLENLKQFGSLKAMGLTNRRILGMILLQAFVAGVIGYCLGLGLTATYFETISRQKVELEGIYLYRQVAILVAGCVTLICLLAGLLSAAKCWCWNRRLCFAASHLSFVICHLRFGTAGGER